jgi:tRNA(Arg) A34 adenosine deaminase TadA
VSDEVVDDARDLEHLRAALAEAAAARAAGDPPFGSVLVDGAGRTIGRARNTTVTGADIAAHPELVLAQAAARQLSRPEAAAATLYTSCEPCPMCANAIARTAIGRVVFALSTRQLDELKPAGYQNPDAAAPTYVGPALLDEARAAIGDYYGTAAD